MIKKDLARKIMISSSLWTQRLRKGDCFMWTIGHMTFQPHIAMERNKMGLVIMKVGLSIASLDSSEIKRE
jgi:hypothetical protein